MTKEDTYDKILEKSENGQIKLNRLYPIINSACEDMQLIIDSKIQEIEKLYNHIDKLENITMGIKNND